MREIPLTQGKVALVDDEDYEWLTQWKWYAHLNRKNGVWYARRNTTTRYGQARMSITMHRAILGAQPNKEVDHWDHDGLHNWRANLRVCTRAQNQQNQCLHKDNTSGYKGVYWCKETQRWRAQIRAEGKRYSLGTFVRLEDAGLAYDAAALLYSGEFACLNNHEQEMGRWE